MLFSLAVLFPLHFINERLGVSRIARRVTGNVLRFVFHFYTFLTRLLENLTERYSTTASFCLFLLGSSILQLWCNNDRLNHKMIDISECFNPSFKTYFNRFSFLTSYIGLKYYFLYSLVKKFLKFFYFFSNFATTALPSGTNSTK